MRTILLSIFIITSINSFSQLSVESSIINIERAVNSGDLANPCTFQYIDSIKFKHPYMTDGQSMGILIVKINKDPDFELKYNIFEYSNKDLITRQLFRVYSLSESISPSPFRSYFFFGKYLFFMNICCPYWSQLDDNYKKLSVKIYEEVDLYKMRNKDALLPLTHLLLLTGI